ncbi:hypothetical protein [Siphonobacter sp. SORGH_AS_1065]|uniref:hypothetical protein n=1 Tax=Siphonobacter sp. SORGH_AS_1065 TaxID=3041795 RepID=UPI00278B9A2F|nr:hypothetical protein [Siphonobacter sp. SORGH_AS_1065]MDQ1089985.1 hypothetical protein [Siphonobacter sp. SORGH_AS_1065]
MPRYQFTACEASSTEEYELTFTYISLDGDQGHERQIHIIGTKPENGEDAEKYQLYLFSRLINFMQSYWEDSYQIPEDDYHIHDSDNPQLEGNHKPDHWKDYILEFN